MTAIPFAYIVRNLLDAPAHHGADRGGMALVVSCSRRC